MRIVLAPGSMAPQPHGVPLTDPQAGGLGARDVAEALAAGWRREKPADDLVLAPLPDGGPGTATALPEGVVAEACTVRAPGAFGQEQVVDLVRLAPHRGSEQGTPGWGTPSTWFLDAAALLALPAGRARAAREASQGSTAGLGLLLSQALAVVDRGDTLVLGLARSAVHDGGAGLIDALGGVDSARSLMAGRDVVVALADDVALGGLRGAGAALAEVTGLDAATAQELDRTACAAASRLVAQVTGGGVGELRRCLPLTGPGTTPSDTLSVTGWGTGAAGGAALALRALGARVQVGARFMAVLTGLAQMVAEADLVVTAAGDVFDVPGDSVVAVAGEAGQAEALPVVLVAGRCAVPRGELAEAGVVSAYQLADGGGWADGGERCVADRVEAMGTRLARTWSR